MAKKTVIKKNAKTSAEIEVNVTNPNTEEIETVTPEVVEKVDEKPEEGGISVDPTAFAESEVTKEKKLVKVRVSKDFTTHIGRKNWDFKAGKLYSVPENVKCILNRAGLLTVL